MSFRNMSLLVVVICVFLAAAATPAAAATINPNDDTWTETYHSGNNYDEVDGIKIRWTNTSLIGHRDGWLEFTLDNVDVTTASFNINNPSQTAGVALTIQLKGAEYSFDETTLTYNTQPDPSGWTDLGTFVWGPGSDIGWFSKDITSFFNSNKGKTVTIWMTSLTQSDNSGPVFEDREGTAGTTNYPYIEYTPVPEPASLLVLAVGFVGLAGLRRRR